MSEISPNLRNVEFFRDVEQVELKTMPFEATSPLPVVAPIKLGRGVKLGRQVKLKPYNIIGT